jgi:hypothetical protein
MKKVAIFLSLIISVSAQDKRQSLKRIGPSLIDRQGNDRVTTILSSFAH